MSPINRLGMSSLKAALATTLGAERRKIPYAYCCTQGSSSFDTVYSKLTVEHVALRCWYNDEACTDLYLQRYFVVLSGIWHNETLWGGSLLHVDPLGWCGDFCGSARGGQSYAVAPPGTPCSTAGVPEDFGDIVWGGLGDGTIRRRYNGTVGKWQSTPDGGSTWEDLAAGTHTGDGYNVLGQAFACIPSGIRWISQWYREIGIVVDNENCTA